MGHTIAEYIWVDGGQPTKKLRSKTKVLRHDVNNLEDIPDWSFDGSSTYQATGKDSDCVLRPVYHIQDPIRGKAHILVLCEVLLADGSPHISNTRAELRTVAARYESQGSLFGIEQEYTLLKGNRPLGWPDNGFPAPQGGYYCGIGADEVFGRPIVEEHMQACLFAGISFEGINSEVMPSQWEFQVGTLDPLSVSDQLWMSRWLLYRIAEKYGVYATLYPKPVKGDWNGAGAHTNFSTKLMREEGGLNYIQFAIEKLEKKHTEMIKVYGAHNEERLTGLHETCHIGEFRYGVSDRGASIRVPAHVAAEGKGYLEDRRPAANMDPYEVCTAIVKTVCGE
ncbi:MAG: glutamine synthetase [Candidatus Magasanikbacteria bacterium]|jgi:glutamine synthetase|nr:glutamine synthetase [Candidatus Magasanikbacteria bacterium]MBT4071728.1 glutamine synthetase [Candidatus Magasanikbacteria bacterium]